MKIEIKKIDELKRELKFEVPKDRVLKTLDSVYQDMASTVKVTNTEVSAVASVKQPSDA